jgi:O-antigen/teichoic acid export membrane protein
VSVPAGDAATTKTPDGPLLKPESVRSRYVATLGAQIFRLLLSVVTATIVPRVLGPAMYGSYSFLMSTSTALRGFLDTGTQQAFFTFSSQERASGALTRLYALALGIQFAIVLAVIGVSAALGNLGWLWNSQTLDRIVLMTVLEWLLFLATSLQQLGDSKGFTTYLQLTGAAVAAFTLVGLVVLWTTASLDFYTFAWLNLTGAAVTCVLQSYSLLVRNRALFWEGAFKVGNYVQRWWRFTRPLILLQYYLPIVAYLGTYLIQKWYGSVEQGYYALALQWSSLALVFTSSGVWIFWREIAHSAGRDRAVAAATYDRFSKIFFVMSVVLACWLSASSAQLVQIVAGEHFRPAASVLALMAFYPVSQTISQLTMACLKATERTSSYARWSVVLSIPDVILTYLLLAPATAVVPGLHLGALGFAIRTAIFGLVSVQLFDWLNCRFLGISYARALGRKVVVAVPVAAFAFAALALACPWLERLGMGSIPALIVCSCTYGAAIALLVWFRPMLVGLTREQILQSWPRVRRGG